MGVDWAQRILRSMVAVWSPTVGKLCSEAGGGKLRGRLGRSLDGAGGCAAAGGAAGAGLGGWAGQLRGRTW